jgi:integrase
MNAMAMKDKDGLHRRPKGAHGIWYFYYRGADGKWHEKSAGTRNYSEARQVRTAELEKRQRGEIPSHLADWTLSDAAALWLEQRRHIVLPVTFSGYRWILAPLLKALGGRRLKEISSPVVQSYQGRRAGLVSARTANREIQTLTTIMRMAKLGRIFEDIKPLDMRHDGIGRALTPEEEERLFHTAASKPAWQCVFSLALLAANTGLRSGEIKRLRLADISIESQTILVRRRATKTSAGERLVPLNSTCLLATQYLLRRANSVGAVSGEHYLLPTNLSKHTKEVVDSAAGFDPSRHQRSWRTAWRRLTRAAGLKGFRFHDLRHHFITKLAEANVPIQVAMSLAGHISMEMTRHYTHIGDRARREAVNAITFNVSPNKLDLPRLPPSSEEVALRTTKSKCPIPEAKSND